jgi:hypothetical protein
MTKRRVALPFKFDIADDEQHRPSVSDRIVIPIVLDRISNTQINVLSRPCHSILRSHSAVPDGTFQMF